MVLHFFSKQPKGVIQLILLSKKITVGVSYFKKNYQVTLYGQLF